MSSPCAPSCRLEVLGRSLARSLERSVRGLEPAAIVAAGGCAAFVAGFLEGNHFRVPLGRSLPFGLGLASARPRTGVLVLLGDGEAAGVGGHHLVHAARRGDRVRAVVVNNEVLEGTGGFPSPTTPRGGRTAALPETSRPAPLDIARLVQAAGAAWVGRETLHGGAALERLLDDFLAADPFALLEIRAPCYPAFGQWNGYATPEAMHVALERRAVRGEVAPLAEPTPEGAESLAPALDRFRVGRLWPPSLEMS